MAFKDIDVGVLVGAMPRREGMERKDLLKANVKIFKQQGQALDQFAKKDVKVWRVTLVIPLDMQGMFLHVLIFNCVKSLSFWQVLLLLFCLAFWVVALHIVTFCTMFR